MLYNLLNFCYTFPWIFSFIFYKTNNPFQYHFSVLYFNILPFPFYGYKWFNMYLCIWFYCIYLSSKLDELCFKFPFPVVFYPILLSSQAILFSYKLNPMTIKYKKGTSEKKHTSSVSTQTRIGFIGKNKELSA